MDIPLSAALPCDLSPNFHTSLYLATTLPILVMVFIWSVFLVFYLISHSSPSAASEESDDVIGDVSKKAFAHGVPEMSDVTPVHPQQSHEWRRCKKRCMTVFLLITFVAMPTVSKVRDLSPSLEC